MIPVPVTTSTASIATESSGGRKVHGRLLALVCNFGWAPLIDDLPLG